jgi:hypothetical protein
MMELLMTDDRVIVRYGDGDGIIAQAQQIWIILVSSVMGAKFRGEKEFKITYGDLAELMGYRDRRAGHMLGRQLGIVGMYCKTHDIAPLNAIVVTQDSEEPGCGVLLREGRSVWKEQASVMKEDWFSIRVPSIDVLQDMWGLVKEQIRD